MPSSIPDSRLLEIFVTLGTSPSLTEAAGQLGISPSAISQAVRRLEKEFEIELFHHDRKPLALTAPGRSLYERTLPLVESLRQLKSEFSLTELAGMSLRLGLGESMTSTLSPWLLGKLYPHLGQLEIHSGFNRELRERLIKNELDVCVFSDGMPGEPGFERRPVYEEEFLCITAKGAPPVNSLEDLASLASTRPYIGYAKGSFDKVQADKFLKETGIRPTASVQNASSYSLVGLVSQIDGWALLPAVNLSSGWDFVNRVDAWPLPRANRIVRRTWVIGRPENKELVGYVANLTRSLFIEHMLPRLERIPRASASVRMLPDAA